MHGGMTSHKTLIKKPEQKIWEDLGVNKGIILKQILKK